MFAQEQVAFKINSHVVTDNTAKKIQQQVEYYFSLANLITDHFLKNVINCSLGGWVKLDIFCAFKKINCILESQVSQKLKTGEIKTIISKSCAKSFILQVNNNAIRKKIYSKGVKDFSRVLYCENIELNNFTSILQYNNIDLNNVVIQKGNNWFFVEFKQINTDSAIIAEQVISKVNALLNPKIILGNEFKKMQIQYAQIVGINPYDCKSHQNQKSNYIQASRIQTYEQVIAQEKQKKTKQIKLKRKFDRTRLPNKYILSAKQKKQVKITKNEINHAFDNIPELKQERQKKLEEIRQYQKRKMQQRLKKKAQLRKNSSKMDIEQQQMANQQV